jgi:hypothetical protein
MSLVRRLSQSICIAALCGLAAGCAAAPKPKGAERPGAANVGRPTLDSSQLQSLQSSVMALADTSIQRIASELNLGRSDDTPEARRDDMSTRLVLSSALIGIAMEPDPVDALADMLTHTTLTAQAQRAVALGKPADSSAARLLAVLELNDADAWRVAERWVNEPTRVAFRERILAWPGPRTSAASAAFVRLSDIKRAGSTSIESDDGLFDSLHAATQQMDQMRLLAERSLYLAQRMPFLMRWQAEVYTGNALATKEAQQTQAQIEQMSLILTEASKMLAGMVAQVSRERQDALNDLFAHIESERKASLEQITAIVRKERATTLEQTGLAIDMQRKALVKDLSDIASSAGRTGSAWIGRTLLIGGVLIVMLLAGLLGTMLLYRRLLPFVDRRGALATLNRPA